jgi:hypothetical protein
VVGSVAAAGKDKQMVAGVLVQTKTSQRLCECVCRAELAGGHAAISIDDKNAPNDPQEQPPLEGRPGQWWWWPVEVNNSLSS